MLYLKRISGLDELKKYYKSDIESDLTDYLNDNAIEYHTCKQVPLVIVRESGKVFSNEWFINFRDELIYDIENNRYSKIEMYEKGESKVKDIYALLESTNSTKQQVIVSANIFEENSGDAVVKHIELLSELYVGDTEESIPNDITFDGMESELLAVIDTLGSKDYYFMALVSANWEASYSYLDGTEYDVEFDVTELKDLNDLKGLI